jgi:hypothetical protein
MNQKKNMLQIHVSEENYKILHTLVCDQMDVIFESFDDEENFEPTAEHQKILEAVTMFSAQGGLLVHE